MSNETRLTDAAREMGSLEESLASHLATSKAEEARLRGEIQKRAQVLRMSADGIDADKIALAKTVVFVLGEYARGGEDRASVIADAVRQLATGVPIDPCYRDIWQRAFGTKSYDRWHGQRCDSEYGMGPRHGSIIFQVGVNSDVRKTRTQADLTASEIEAAIYYLTNLERVQSAEAAAKAKSEAA